MKFIVSYIQEKLSLNKNLKPQETTPEDIADYIARTNAYIVCGEEIVTSKGWEFPQEIKDNKQDYLCILLQRDMGKTIDYKYIFVKLEDLEKLDKTTDLLDFADHLTKKLKYTRRYLISVQLLVEFKGDDNYTDTELALRNFNSKKDYIYFDSISNKHRISY